MKMMKMNKNVFVLLGAFFLTLFVYLLNSGFEDRITREAYITINAIIIPFMLTAYIFFLTTPETRLYYLIKRKERRKNRLLRVFFEPMTLSFIAIIFSLTTNGLVVLSSDFTYYCAVFFSLWALLQSFLVIEYVTDVYDEVIDEITKQKNRKELRH